MSLSCQFNPRPALVPHVCSCRVHSEQPKENEKAGEDNMNLIASPKDSQQEVRAGKVERVHDHWAKSNHDAR